MSDSDSTEKLKFTEDSLGSRLIRHLFRKKIFNDKIGPAKAYSMNQEFWKYGKAGFKGRYYKEKKRHKSKTLPSESNVDELDRLISGITTDQKPKIKSKKSKPNSDADFIDDEEIVETGAVTEGMNDLLEDPVFIKLPMSRSIWVDNKERNRVSYSINLPSGVQPLHVLYRVVKDGWGLEVEITWPEELSNASKLLHNENIASSSANTTALADYYPKLQGYQKFIKSIKDKEDDEVQQLLPITTPFQVETHVPPEMVNFKQLHGSVCCVVEINLVEVSNEYFVNRGRGEFKKM